jgi:hypothetical protein
MVHLGLALWLTSATAHQKTAVSAIVTKKQLALNFANKGVRVYLATYSGSLPFEPRERLLLETAGTKVVVTHLSDLKGVVHIDNEAAALKYVRLRTSPATWYLWHESQMVEIVDNSVASKLPSYGLGREGTNHARSGFMGILSSAAFNQGNFTAASVSETEAGFVVKRWLLKISGKKKTVELIQETLGKTGAYNRAVLQSKAAPQLRDTNWYIIKFE